MNDDRNKFTFTMQNGEFQNTMTFRADTWCEALENFEDFMRGCGYVFTGNFDLVEQEIFEVNEPEPLYDPDERSDDFNGEWQWDNSFGYPNQEDLITFTIDGRDQQHPGVPCTMYEGQVVTGWPFTSEEK